jgi:hypothetical protein
MTFKAGDKVYYYNYGIVELTTGEIPHYPLKVMANGQFTFTQCGRRYSDDKYPTLVTLEKAGKMGLVRKKVTYRERLQVKYFDTDWEKYCFSCFYYNCESDFRRVAEPEWNFVSFVDEKLNECDPPQETVEWEEV